MRHLPTAVLLAAFCAFVQQTSSFCLLTHSNLYVNSLRSGRAGRQCSFTKPQMPLLRAWRDAGRRGYDVVMTANDQSWVRPPPRGSKDIVFGGKVETLVPVQPKCDPGCDLPAYMQLPMDQYVLIPLPNKAKLERADNDHFKLLVPELQFFNVWVRPRLLARVQVTPQGVIIEASECKLEGSPEVSRLDLNARFDFRIRVDLSCKIDPRGLRSLIIGRSEIKVWADPPYIFRAMFPRNLMEQTGNAVLRTAVNLLQATFMDGLARDYGRWAVDEKYRQERRAASGIAQHTASPTTSRPPTGSVTAGSPSPSNP